MLLVIMVWVLMGIVKMVFLILVVLVWLLMVLVLEYVVIERVRVIILFLISNLSDVGENGNKECDGDKEVLLCVVVFMVNNFNVIVVI